MQINLKSLKIALVEDFQSNSLRYVCLHQTGEEQFENTTNVFKCKDYFNDFVAHKHGYKPFKMFGMPSAAAKFDQYGGLTILVSGITPNLEGNIRRVLTPFRKLWGADVQFRLLAPTDIKGSLAGLNGDTALLWFSPECFASTFRISMLTLFIRNCNYRRDFADYDAVFHRKLVMEGQWRPEYMDLIQGQKFDFSEQQEYWWWFGTKQNSKVLKEVRMVETLHNNGQANWLTQLIGMKQCDIAAFWEKFPHPMTQELDEMDEDEEEEEELDFESEEQ